MDTRLTADPLMPQRCRSEETAQQRSAQLRLARLSYSQEQCLAAQNGHPAEGQIILLHIAIHTFRSSLLFAYFSSILMHDIHCCMAGVRGMCLRIAYA